MEVWLHHSLTQALDGVSGGFTPEERSPQYPNEEEMSGPQSRSAVNSII
jgi:hypothetical protein